VVKSVYFVMEHTMCNLFVLNIYVAIVDIIQQQTLSVLVHMSALTVQSVHSLMCY